MPPEMQKIVRDKIQEGKRDELGSKGVNVFFTNDETWCLTDASSPDAIHKAHEAVGLKLGAGDVKEVASVVQV